ncbi:MAG: cytochrome c family protein [Erythrobacter sp.]|jgi:cytochrome c|nr:cytochrome c family protein [Erythrobacter sp.]
MKRNFLMGAAALAGLMTLSACGGGAADETPAPAAEETAAAPAAEEAAPAEAEATDATEATDAAATETAAAGAGLQLAGLTGDPAKGEKTFALCRSCHVLEEGVNRVGPSLYNIVGRKSGSVAGFNYSEANKNSGVTWTTDVLFEYLKDPKGFMPGTKMAFPGIKNDQDRANLVAYLDSQTK